MKEVIDRDGNVLKKGMSVVSGGDYWIIGYASRSLCRLDRKTLDNRMESRIVGRKRFCCIHIIG